MPRGPFIIESPMGRLYLLDLGFGASMLIIEQEGEAMSYPLDADEASRVATWFGAKAAGRSRPRQTTQTTAIDYEEVAALYQSDEAGEYGNRMEYTAKQLGISMTTASGRVARAKELRLITKKFRGDDER